jgi:hypothetical protein
MQKTCRPTNKWSVRWISHSFCCQISLSKWQESPPTIWQHCLTPSYIFLAYTHSTFARCTWDIYGGPIAPRDAIYIQMLGCCVWKMAPHYARSLAGIINAAKNMSAICKMSRASSLDSLGYSRGQHLILFLFSYSDHIYCIYIFSHFYFVKMLPLYQYRYCKGNSNKHRNCSQWCSI